MRVSIGTIEVTDRERYVIAKYFGKGTRATRKQVREFVLAALVTSVSDHSDAFRGLQRTTVLKLSESLEPEPETLKPLKPPQPVGRQLKMFDGNLRNLSSRKSGRKK